ncbi:hypothetical protein ACFL54_02805 [Planctomycetota bacterium]
MKSAKNTSIGIAGHGLALLILAALCFPGSLQADTAYKDFKLELQVTNQQELLLAKDKAFLKVDLSRVKLPCKTTLAVHLFRIYPVLEKTDRLQEDMLRMEQFRILTDSHATRRYSMQPYSDMPPAAGHYRVMLRIDGGQHPRLRGELDEARRHLLDQAIVFVGAKSQAYANIMAETRQAVAALNDLLEVYSTALSNRTVYIDGEPEVISQKPANAQEVMVKLGGMYNRYFSRKKALTMPAMVEYLRDLRNGMVAELQPKMPPSPPRELDRYCATLEILFLRNSVLNIHYYTHDAYTRVDDTFKALVENPDPELQTQMQQEWTGMHQAATELWTGLQNEFFSDKFLAANETKRSIGWIYDNMIQMEVDCLAFCRLVKKEKFLDTVTDYLDILNRLQQAYSERLKAGSTSANTGKIRALTARVKEYDLAIRQKLRIRGKMPDPEKDTAPD